MVFGPLTRTCCRGNVQRCARLLRLSLRAAPRSRGRTAGSGLGGAGAGLTQTSLRNWVCASAVIASGILNHHTATK